MSDNVQVACGHCDSIVRVPADRLSQAPRCPSCHQSLFQGHAIELDQNSFERHVSRTDLPVVVDFWAPWCGPCKMMAPHFEEAARRLEPRVRFAKVNTENESALAARFGIRSIPTLALFRGGREVARQAGAMDAGGLVRWIGAQV